MVTFGIGKLFYLVKYGGKIAVIRIISAIVSEVSIVHELIKIFFNFGFCFLPRNLVDYDKVFLKFALLKRIVWVDTTHSPPTSGK